MFWTWEEEAKHKISVETKRTQDIVDNAKDAAANSDDEYSDGEELIQEMRNIINVSLRELYHKKPRATNLNK